MQNSDDNRFDLDIRAILESGQEDVPASIWDNLTPRLDVMAEERRRKIFMRWMGRVTITATVAAAIAIAAVFPWGAEISMPSDDDAIAVVEPQDKKEVRPEGKYIAMAAEVRKSEPATRPQEVSYIKAEAAPSVIPAAEISAQEEAADAEVLETGGQEETEIRSETNKERKESEDFYSGFNSFGQEAEEREKVNVSITMSGNALSNSKSKGAGVLPMRAPEMQGRNSFEEKTESSYGIPLSFGIGARVGLTPRWSISAGVNYTLLSRSFRGRYTDNDGKQTAETSIINNQSYIGIPVNVYFNIISGDFVDFYAYAGGAMEKCIENRFLLKDATPDIVRLKAKGLQWSANIGLGAEFILTDWLGLYIDPSLRYYFNGGQPKSIRTVQPLSLGFELGFRIRL